jgi:transposase
MKSYSLDLRQRVLAAVDAGQLNRGQIARLFAVSTAWIRRLVQRRRQAGSIAPLPHHGGPAPKLGAEPLRRLGELVRAQPDATLQELRTRLGEPVSVMTVCRALRRLRLPLKKSPSGPPSRRGPTWRGSGSSTGPRSATWNRAG